MTKKLLIIFILLTATPCFGATQQVFIGGVNEILDAAATEYAFVNGAMHRANDNEWSANIKYVVMPTAGIIDDFRVRLSAAPDNGAGTQSFTFGMLLDDAPTTISTAVSEAATTSQDSDGFSVTAGQKVSFQDIPANTPTVSIASWSWTWNPTTEDESIWLCGSSGTDTLGTTTQYLAMHAGGGIDTVAQEKQSLISTPGTFSKLYIELSADPGDGNTRTFAFGTVDCTVTGSAGGTNKTCNSGADTQAATAGQTYTLISTVTGTPAATTLCCGIVFDPTTTGEWMIAFSKDTDQSAVSVHYQGISAGDESSSTTETDWYQLGQAGTFPTPMTIEDIYVFLSAAPGVGLEDRGHTLRINGVGSALNCTAAEAATTCNEQAQAVSIANDNLLDTELDPTVGVGNNPNAAYSHVTYTAFIPPTVASARRVILTQ